MIRPGRAKQCRPMYQKSMQEHFSLMFILIKLLLLLKSANYLMQTKRSEQSRVIIDNVIHFVSDWSEIYTSDW